MSDDGLHFVALSLGGGVLSDALLQVLEGLLVFSGSRDIRLVGEIEDLPNAQQFQGAALVRSKAADLSHELANDLRFLRDLALAARLALLAHILGGAESLFKPDGESFDGLSHCTWKTKKRQ
ncbi:hypothetical protein L596_018491 [Steinernema carpocapsae]|uniref:Uncharacterized protein n=1 Tax=Steinernema carpocapsae TaxID=34508 RepID=A0A4U5N525_STECR|nr:hypothetical protein L596_018491 [Steinernema carpocapsae]